MFVLSSVHLKLKAAKVVVVAVFVVFAVMFGVAVAAAVGMAKTEKFERFAAAVKICWSKKYCRLVVQANLCL